MRVQLVAAMPATSRRLLHQLLLLLALAVGVCVGQDFYAGYYNQHPVYRSDVPSRFHFNALKQLPLGLPMGGKARAGGAPYGVYAYAMKMGGWRNLWNYMGSPNAVHRQYGSPADYNPKFYNFW